jgi:dTMP kinase
MKPLFIVLEGLDGSGSSTQARKLVEYLSKHSERKVRLTSEPSGGPVGQMIRTGMSGRLKFSSDKHQFDRQMAYLFAADRYDHLHNETDGILGHIQRGYTVVSTRYYFSSFAYHCDTADDFQLVRKLNEDFPHPDITIFLDVPVTTSVSRLNTRSHLDQYENATKLTVVRENYHKFFSTYSGKLLWLNGEGSEEEIHTTIRNAVLEVAYA